MSFRKQSQISRRRGLRGSILCLATIVAMCIGVVAVWALMFGFFMQAQHRVEIASEAAAMSAANCASNIVINDQHFGYIALTDWPAGKATLNPNGDPMPVMGINTLVATCRFNLLVAEKLSNQDMMNMARRDSIWAAQTSVALNKAITSSLDPNSISKPNDKDGLPVDAYRSAKATFQSNMPVFSKIQLDSLKLSLGYLSAGCGSATAVPQPLSMSQTDQTTQSGGYYNAFIDVPVRRQHFYFAGLSARTGLVKKELFKPADQVRPCSVIRAQCQVSVAETLPGDRPVSIRCDSCAVPGANPDLVPPAVLALKLDQNLLSSFPNWTALLSYNQLGSDPAILEKVNGGDYPPPPSGPYLTIDRQFNQSGQSTLAELAAMGLYDWLRTCHGKAHIDAVTKMVPLSFPRPIGANSYIYLTYDIDTNDGSVSCQNLQSFPWLSSVVRDGEDLTDYPAMGTPHPAIYFVDETTRLGKDGGLHAGQPLLDALSTNPYQRVYPKNGLAVSIEIGQ